ncbi:neuronal acetylcholine receptor subunit alpha-7-like [Argopecten irradians]|uniref:neuronal acetylcholine receptor subunit alpha-7-like n=1 Tax=Argopecten irradians TaxID=31199 RepID=UPI00372046C8
MNRFRVMLIFFLLNTAGQFVVGSGNGTMDDWLRLRDTLFSNYSKDIYPVHNFSDVLHIDTSMFLLSFIDFDEVSGVITLSAGLTLIWKDYRLRWNPDNYGGIKQIQLNASKIWKPKVYVISAADDLRQFGDDEFDVIIRNSGYVDFSPGKLMKSTCSVDMKRFPVDTQVCHILVMLWGSLSNLKLTFTQTNMYLSYYTPNGEWDIDKTSVSDYMGYGSPSRTLDFTLQITRRHLYFIVSLTIPILLLCFLNPFVFLLPASSGERISYTITMFLSLAVYMTLMGDNLPKVSENMAGMSFFLLICLIYSSVLIVLTIFTLRCEATKDVSEFPRWLRLLTRCRGRLLSNDVRAYSKSTDVGGEAKEKESPVDGEENDPDVQCLKVSHQDIMRCIDHTLFLLSFVFVFIISVWFLAIHHG